jgi:hypothetical protein
MPITYEIKLTKYFFFNRLINLFETFLRIYERARQTNEIPNDM